MDATYAARLRERQQTLMDHPNAVGCLPDVTTITAVKELYSFLLTQYLPVRYPSIFVLLSTQSPTMVLNKVTSLSMPAIPPLDPLECLRILATNLDEDIFILLPCEDKEDDRNGEWQVRACALLCAVDFDPQDKLGSTLTEIHKPVPGFHEVGMGRAVHRFLRRLAKGEFWWRSNWSISPFSTCWVHGKYHVHEGEEVAEEQMSFQGKDCFLRSERQVFFKLHASGARILMPHLYIIPLQQIKDEGEGEALCEAIEGLKLGTTSKLWQYKGAGLWGQKVIEYLRS